MNELKGIETTGERTDNGVIVPAGGASVTRGFMLLLTIATASMAASACDRAERDDLELELERLDDDEGEGCLSSETFCSVFPTGSRIALLTDHDTYVGSSGDVISHGMYGVSSGQMFYTECNDSGQVALRTRFNKYVGFDGDEDVEHGAQKTWFDAVAQDEGGWAFYDHLEENHLHVDDDQQRIMKEKAGYPSDTEVEPEARFVVEHVPEFCDVYEGKKIQLSTMDGGSLVYLGFDDGTPFGQVSGWEVNDDDYFVPDCTDGNLAFKVYEGDDDIGYMSATEKDQGVGMVELLGGKDGDSTRFIARKAPNDTWALRAGHGRHTLLRVNDDGTVDHNGGHDVDLNNFRVRVLR